VDLAAQLLGDVGLDRHSGPAGIGQFGVLEVGRPDAEDHLLVEEPLQAGPGLDDHGGNRKPVPSEDHARAGIAEYLGGNEVHRR
jgi:hypothetical protein